MAKRDLKAEIVRILSDGTFHSGEKLGHEFGISRAAVANHIKSLSELGLDIFSVHGKGYRLASDIVLLNNDAIASYASSNHSLDIYNILGSTNDQLLQTIRQGGGYQDGYTVIAECQTKGRGRRGRQWQSPFGSHIYLSQFRIMEDGLIAASGMSLAIGVAILRACNRFIEGSVELKWPNDILHEGRKLAGILVEAEGQSDGACSLVIGIGVNFDMPEVSSELIDQPWTDFKQISRHNLDRNQLAAAILDEIELVMTEYRENRLANLAAEWNEHNAFKNRQVNLISSNNVKQGRCLGIDGSGALLLEDNDSGLVQKIYGGEVSLRAS